MRNNSYDRVALEYYDPALHPTCADFRLAAQHYLSRLMSSEKPKGKIADIGAGKSLIREFVKSDLVLIDSSSKMLERNSGEAQKRQIDISIEPFGNQEFDWIFSILGDPYNSEAAWGNIARALKAGGRCVFCVPSWTWTKKFRDKTSSERPGCARFDLADGSVVYLESIVLPEREQRSLIAEVGLSIDAVDQVAVGDLKEIRSPKIKKFLASGDPILDVYRVRK